MKKNATALLILVFGLLVLNSTAQNSLYFMQRMPQSLDFNPALAPDIGYFISLPGLSMVQAEIYNSGFSFGDLDEFMDRLEDDNYDPDSFVRKIGTSNQTYAETKVNLLGFGFRLKEKSYLSFSLSQRTSARMNAPSNVGYLIYSAVNEDLEYLDDRLPIEIRGLDMEMNVFSQLAVTWSRKIGDHFTVGISPKLIGGTVALKSNNLNARLSREWIEEEFGSYYEYETDYSGSALVGLPVPVNPDAIGDNNELNDDADLLPDDWSELYGPGKLFQNAGLAFDIGVKYVLNEQWHFSASLLDLGNTSWKKNGYKIEFNQDAGKLYDDQTFKVKIPAKLYAGAGYSLSSRWVAGVLLRHVFHEDEGFTSATLSMNGYIGRMLSATFSYTASHTWDNLGIGFRLRILPGADLYAVTDNMLQLINYKDSRHASVAFGLNMSFGVR